MTEYKDFIEYQIHNMMLIEWYKHQRFIFYPKYRSLFFVMKGKHQTFDEIFVAYNNYILEFSPHKNVKQIKKPTLYKYLADLEGQGLIKKTGRRVIIGQTASQPLYSYVAKNFFPKAFAPSYIDSEVGMNLVKTMYAYLSLLPSIKEHDFQDMREYFDAIHVETTREVSSLLKDYSEIDPGFLDEFDQKDLRKFMTLLRRFFMIYKVSNYEDQLSNLKKDGK